MTTVASTPLTHQPEAGVTPTWEWLTNMAHADLPLIELVDRVHRLQRAVVGALTTNMADSELRIGGSEVRAELAREGGSSYPLETTFSDTIVKASRVVQMGKHVAEVTLAAEWNDPSVDEVQTLSDYCANVLGQNLRRGRVAAMARRHVSGLAITMALAKTDDAHEADVLPGTEVDFGFSRENGVVTLAPRSKSPKPDNAVGIRPEATARVVTPEGIVEYDQPPLGATDFASVVNGARLRGGELSTVQRKALREYLVAERQADLWNIYQMLRLTHEALLHGQRVQAAPTAKPTVS